MSTVSVTNLKHESASGNNITLDSDGNVRLASATDTTSLNGLVSNKVKAKTTDNYVFIHESSTANRNFLLEHQTTGRSTTIRDAQISLGNDGADGGVIRISTAPSGSDVLNRVIVDAGGRVSIPYKPMFMGTPSQDYSAGGMPTGILAFTAQYNNGNHFNGSNSRFTAPITGWYRITWGGLQLTSAVTSLMVNGARTYSGNHTIASGYMTMTQTVIRYLNAGDYLNIEGWNGGGYYNSWYLWTVEHIA